MSVSTNCIILSDRMPSAVLLLLQVVLIALVAGKYQFPAEWHAWKATHGKSYTDEHEELRKHVVWVSNQKYISEHNQHQERFGYTLEMNQFGDMVCLCKGLFLYNYIIIMHMCGELCMFFILITKYFLLLLDKC